MSVSTNFKNFCFNLKMDDLTVSTIRLRYKRIVKQINQSYWGTDSEIKNGLYVGSYGRGTEIWTSDIDMIVTLPYLTYAKFNKYAGNGQSALLQNVKEEIKKTYSTSSIRGDGQVIGISFKDGISFEIVPAFLHKDGSSYIYPNTNNGGSWQITNPRAEINAMTAFNIQKNKNLKRLCRMARSWKSTCNVPINGVLIDTLAYNFLNSTNKYDDKSYLYYDWMSRDFFKYLMEINLSQESWLAPGSRRKVFKKENFQYKAKQAYNKSLEAIANEENSNLAKKAWREIYGSKFGV